MKKILLLALPALFFTFFVSAQTERLVLVESFTQASCGPCASQNPGFDAMLNQNIDKVVVLKYQTSWPGYDPMNEHNPDEVQTRVSYYGVTGVPNVRIDGTLNAGTSGQATVGQINNAYAIPAELEINPTHSFAADLSTVTINCDVTNPDMTTPFDVADARLRVAVSEKNIVFPGGAPGSNGETEFHYVMRKMLPDAMGTLVGTINPGETKNFTWTVAVPDYIYDFSEIMAVAFVQANASKKVFQAAKSEPQPLPAGVANAGFSTSTAGPSGLCEYELVPAATVNNDGDVEITNFEVSYTLNGGTPVVENWSGNLMPGEEVEVVFPTVSISPGSTVLQYSIADINGFPDIYAHNDNAAPESFYTLQPAAIGPVTEDGFEGPAAGENPEGVIVNKENNLELVVVDPAFLGASGAAGGYAASQQSVFFYFWGIQNYSASMTFQKLDWTDRVNDKITFDMTYRQYSSENDRLQVHISTDCGVTWTSVYDKAGSALSTIAPNQANYLAPAAGDWRTEEIDLSAYDGTAEVVVRFTGTSAYGNNLFIDNINIGGELVSAVEDVIAQGNVNVYPNPAAGPVSVDFTMLQTDQVSVEIFDVTGKLVETLANGQIYGAGSHSLEWSNPSESGLYLVKVTTSEGQVTQKVSVLK